MEDRDNKATCVPPKLGHEDHRDGGSNLNGFVWLLRELGRVLEFSTA
jgi:hypothetical protein